MADLTPSAILRVYNDDTEKFGRVLAAPQSLSYDLPGLIGTPGAFYNGFQRDPTGRYLCQQIVPVAVDTPPSAWIGSTAFDTFGTDVSTGKKFLFHSSSKGAFNLFLTAARVQDEGFECGIYLGAAAPSAVANFYLEFSRGRAFNETGLRLAFDPGNTIRLQASYDNDNSWTDVASADSLGECEGYLDGNNRRVSVSVLAMCDASWEAGLPGSLALSGPPPGIITVSINGGDAVLEFAAPKLSAGSLAFTGQNRQVSLRVSQLRHAITGQVSLPPQIRPEPLTTVPTAYLNGYVPYKGGVSGQVFQSSLNSASVVVFLAATADGATGYALRSCYLSTVDAEFPAWQIDPLPSPGYVDYAAIYSEVRKSWDQTSGTVRHKAYLIFANDSDQFAPGVLVEQSAKAASLYHSIGAGDFLPGVTVETIFGVNYALEMTGWTAMEEDGQGWYYENGLKYFRVTLSDRLVHTESDTGISAGFQLPYDFQCQYYGFGQQAYRAGISDFWWTFPNVRRGQVTPFYYFDGGTADRPLHQFPPDMNIGDTMEHCRALGAEFDPISGQPQPMVIATNPDGSLAFFGLPIGVVSCLIDPSLSYTGAGLTAAQVYSKVPGFNADGSAALNEFVQTWSSKSSLRRVRTPVVLVGLDPQSGSAIFGVAYNEQVGGGPYSNPGTPGYIGINKPLYITSRLYSSQAVADLSAQKAAILLSAPAVDTSGKLHLQPGMEVLTVIGVQDYSTQGTTSAVGYYTTHVTGIVDLRNPQRHSAETLISARVLGQAS
jgi:hypothetical protein